MPKKVDSTDLLRVKDKLRERVSEFAHYAYPIFLQNGWTYFDGQPDKPRLREVARECIRKLTTGAQSSAQTGRIQAYYQVFNGQVHAGLRIYRTDDDVIVDL